MCGRTFIIHTHRHSHTYTYTYTLTLAYLKCFSLKFVKKHHEILLSYINCKLQAKLTHKRNREILTSKDNTLVKIEIRNLILDSFAYVLEYNFCTETE